MKHALITLRKYHQLTQLELANKLGIAHQYVSRMEARTKRVTPQTIKQLCKLFKISKGEYTQLERLITSSKIKKAHFVYQNMFTENFKEPDVLRKYIEWDLKRIKP